MTEFLKEDTVKLYDEDSHEKEFTALVRACTKSGDFFKVELDRTAFFPEGGGQPGDTGVLLCVFDESETQVTEVEVTDTHIKDGVVLHYTSTQVPVGTKLLGRIDWEKRFKRMQCHSAEHIVSGLVNSEFGFDNIGFHLGNDDVTCDYNGELTWDEIKRIEVLANAAVFDNLPIKTEFPSFEELSALEYRSKLDFDMDSRVRIVTIPGIDCCACCAPHVNRTGEIGLIKLVGHEKSHGGTRLHLRAGYTALSDYDEKQTNMLRIIDLLSARQFETADCVEQLQKANAQLCYEMGQASKALAQARLDTMPDGLHGNIVVCLPGANTDALRALANGGKLKCDGVFVALTRCEEGYRYMITSSTALPLRTLAKDFNSCLVGRGGGKDDMIQGVFMSELPVIQDFFDNWMCE